MLEWPKIMCQLADDRPVFHAEADFQHALAWKLREALPDASVRLEYRPFKDERLYTDIWVRTHSGSIAIELKYLTRRLSAHVNGESFNLSDQAAQDISRYDFVKDIVRLERVVDAGHAAVGYAVLLTNDRGYWRPSTRSTTVDAAFRVHEDRMLMGTSMWSPAAGPGTTRGRDQPLTLRSTYRLQWADYPTVEHALIGKFRYLLVEVRSQADSD